MTKGLIVHSIIYNNKHEVLLLKRAKSNKILPGFWDIPGGTLEDGEDPMAGAIREVKEETSLTITNPELFFYTSNVDRKKNKQFVRLIFLVKINKHNIKLNSKEHEEYQWLNINQTIKYKLVDYLPKCFKRLQSRF